MRLSAMLMRACAMCAIATLLAACGTSRKVSVADGEARALEGPKVEIHGATIHDQQWIDETIEAGVRGLGWERPGPRPVEWDRPLSPAAAPAIAKAAVPKSRPKWLKFLRGKETGS